MRVVAVIGPPCSGKSTFVAERRQPGDLVVDWDDLAVALGSPDPHTHAEWLKGIVAEARRGVYRWMQTRGALPAAGTAWVVSCFPPPLRIVTDTVVMDTDEAVCLERARVAGRSRSTVLAIREWFSAEGQARVRDGRDG